MKDKVLESRVTDFYRRVDEERSRRARRQRFVASLFPFVTILLAALAGGLVAFLWRLAF